MATALFQASEIGIVRDPLTRDQPATGDHLLAAVVLFDIPIDEYTSGKRPPLLKDHFLQAFVVVACFAVYGTPSSRP